MWLASGFGGHGLNTTAMAGNLVARAIVHNDQTWREFSAFELVWAGGIAGRIGVQAYNWVKRYRDAMNERRAKARERAHIAAREAEERRQAEEEARQAAEAAAAERQAAEAEEARRLAAIEAERQAAEAEEARRLAVIEDERQAAQVEEVRRLAAEEDARQRAAEYEATQRAADEEAARLAAISEAEAPLQSEPPAGDSEQPPAVVETPSVGGEQIAEVETTSDLEQPVRGPPTKRRTKNRRKRERPQPDRRKSEITPD